MEDSSRLKENKELEKQGFEDKKKKKHLRTFKNMSKTSIGGSGETNEDFTRTWRETFGRKKWLLKKEEREKLRPSKKQEK